MSGRLRWRTATACKTRDELAALLNYRRPSPARALVPPARPPPSRSVDPIPDADVTFPVSFNGANYQVYVRKRPHLDKFLQWIAGKFEVTIFTASQQVYAEKLLNLLDPESRYISYRLYRDSCLNVDGNYLKDLNVLGRDLSKTVLVDNSPHAFGYQVRGARSSGRAKMGGRPPFMLPSRVTDLARANLARSLPLASWTTASPSSRGLTTAATRSSSS